MVVSHLTFYDLDFWVRFEDDHVTSISFEKIENASDGLYKEEFEKFFKNQPHQLKLKIEGGTPFQRQVWKALLEIPYAQLCSYQQIANRIGHPKAVRAVGSAIGKNPIPILIPCHRVIKKNGQLGNYTGGTHIKKRLLEVEKNE